MKISSLILLITLFLLASCGEDKKELPKQDEKNLTMGPIEIDACSLLEKEGVENIFDIEMKEPRKGRSQKGDANTDAFSECTFESGNEGPKILLSVYIRFTPFKDENPAAIQNVRNSFKQSGIEVKNIDGISDVAFWGANQLHVFKGDNYYLIITLIGLKESSQAMGKAKAVALYVIGKINSI